MNDNEMRILFAAFAMLKMDWSSKDSDDGNAKNCFDIADAMIKAKKDFSLEDVGIVAIRKRRPTK